MIFQQGDIVLASLDPVSGNEQAGMRPMMVVQRSDVTAILRSTVFVVPISTSAHRFPFEVALDDRTKTTGFLLCRHIRAIDLFSRNAKFIESAPADIVENCIRNIKAMIAEE